MPTLKVSINTYDEIYDLLEKEGRKPGDAKQIVLEKNDQLVTSVNYKQVTIRRDCAEIASKTYQFAEGPSFVEYTNDLYEYVLNGVVVSNTPKTEGWK